MFAVESTNIPLMKNALLYLIGGKKLFLPSFCIGTGFAAVSNFFMLHTPQQMFGYSLTIWGVALMVNAWDIYTGIRADTKRAKDKGEGFKFNPEKGQKAFEKILGFTAIIALVYSFELEAIRLLYSNTIVVALNAVKSIFFFYVILIELQSIGNNNEERFGDKGKLFKMLDTIIAIVNDGIVKKVKDLFNINSNSDQP